ncbi:hypothetical protein F4814DRAFT_381428 [Daldinia grandis]|nr:hypothetical protein F4814DRAFT_381428 [Daldinia grandis]
MSPVTEFISLNLKPDLPAAEATTILNTTAATLAAQPGCLRVRTSRLHEDVNAVRIFADWATVTAHRAFEKTEAYAPFKARVYDAVASRPQRPYHIEFAPFPVAALDNSGPASKTPVAEVLHIWFAGDYPEDARRRTADAVAEFTRRMTLFAEGLTGETALGWTVERDIDHDGVPSSALVLILGWTSVEAHMKARDHPEFAKIVPLLKDLEGLKGLEMNHVSNTTVEASS